MEYDNFLFQNARKRVQNVKENFQVTDLIYGSEENGKKDLKTGNNSFSDTDEKEQHSRQVIGVKGKDISTGKEEEFRAKIVVGADGASSIVASKLGLNNPRPEHECLALRVYYENIQGCTPNIEIHFVDSLLPGYFWIFPLENNTANVGVGMITAEVKKRNANLQEQMFKVIAEDPLFKERFANAKPVSGVKGWRLPLGSFHRKAHGNGWLLVGDAASLIDPFSGEGVGNAMTSGRIAAEWIDKAIAANDCSESFLKQFEEAVWKDLGNELKTSYRLQQMGKIKPLLNLVIGKASRNKEIRETISGMIANENAKQNLINPLFYLKLLLG
jgi:flavin-dependent dehydrogenase